MSEFNHVNIQGCITCGWEWYIERGSGQDRTISLRAWSLWPATRLYPLKTPNIHSTTLLFYLLTHWPSMAWTSLRWPLLSHLLHLTIHSVQHDLQDAFQELCASLWFTILASNTPSFPDWNPDSSRYIPICEPLSVHLQCNWWAILGRGNYIPCVLDISIPSWPLFLSHPVCKTPGWRHREHHMNIRSSNPREAHPILLMMTLWWCWVSPLTMVSICLCGMRDLD